MDEGAASMQGSGDSALRLLLLPWGSMERVREAAASGGWRTQINGPIGGERARWVNWPNAYDRSGGENGPFRPL